MAPHVVVYDNSDLATPHRELVVLEGATGYACETAAEVAAE